MMIGGKRLVALRLGRLGAGGEFLAGAAFALDEDGFAGGGDAADGAVLTAFEVDRETVALAVRLAAAGVLPGDRVMLSCAPSAATVVASCCTAFAISDCCTAATVLMLAMAARALK